VRLRLLLPCAALLCGCAILGKSTPVVPRYFTAEYARDGAVAGKRPDLRVRLGRVEAGTHLRERMAGRRSARELYFYEERRWSELPEVYLRRALASALYEERGLGETESAHALTLDVELLAFEEIDQPHEARLQALLVLREGERTLSQETITVEQPVAGGSSDEARAVAEALSLSLQRGVKRIADRVLQELSPAGQPGPGSAPPAVRPGSGERPERPAESEEPAPI
jgi:cholesterol transport system auxiliary component